MAFNLETFINELKDMKVSELNDLVKAIEEEFGVSAAAPVAAAASSTEDEDGPKTLELTDAGGSKVPVIKLVRELTGLGLMDAKKLVDAAPSMLKENVEPAQAEEIIASFKEIGATVSAK
ncbi:MAG: 50S ribosomal protein L7/L12 [Tenericutes bacterium]|nr:MAG: 50S ribosomal protein L7/L12 [Mycoplasmatota bacterium]